MLPISAIHPNPRANAAPSNGVSVDCNPPSLLWPAASGRSVRYSVRLSKSHRFPKRGTISEAGLPWAMFTPSVELNEGVWHWQVGTSKGGRIKWSEVQTFTVTATAKKSVLPSSTSLFETASAKRPRLMPAGKEIRANRSQRTQELALGLYRRTSHLIDQSLPDDTTPPAQGDNEYKQMKFARWGSKRLAGEQVSAVEALICAGLLNGDERFFEEAERRALNVATWHPDGFTNPVISDFADASCMRAMALVYDTSYDRLSGSERRQLRQAMVARCRRFYEDSVNGVEARLFGAHLWQHLLTEFFEAALALVGDVPEARVWCRYIYELWVARFPLVAGDDGGWANGPKYFGTNVETLILMTRYFDQLGATGFDERPWFRNASKFLRYAWPVDSENDGFGDGTELERTPSANHIHWMDHLGHRFGDPRALQYAASWRQKGADAVVSPRLSLLSLEWKKPRRKNVKPDRMAHLFRDTGLVSMHTDRDHIEKNLSVAFCSCPFGSFNHMHSSQNAFNLFYGGERLFANSGYYVAMADDHAKEWYRDTRGHNTILIDGKSQTRSPEGFGWIPRFIDGDSITYLAGDASNAYGDAGLVRYRRHVAILHPNIVVIYDDLVADHDARWTWQLHAQRKLSFSKRAERFSSRNGKGKAELAFMASTAYDVEVGDTFDPPAVNWGGKSYFGKAVESFPARWHGSARTEPTTSARFLSIISVGGNPLSAKRLSDGNCRVGQWKISASMDIADPASLVVSNARKKVALAVDTHQIDLLGSTYRSSNSTILIEAGRSRRSRDKLPSAARSLI
jgi:hypothetical protein